MALRKLYMFLGRYGKSKVATEVWLRGVVEAVLLDFEFEDEVALKQTGM